MQSDVHNGYRLRGWTVSLLLHLGVVVAAAMMMQKMTVPVEQEPFRWDVAVVEPATAVVSHESAAPIPSVEPTPSPQSGPAKPVEPAPSHDMVMARVAPPHSPQVVHPPVQVPKPQQPVAPAHAAPPLQEVAPSPVKPVEPEELKKPEVRESAPLAREAAKQEPVNEPRYDLAPVAERSAPQPRMESHVATADQPVKEPPQESVAVADAPPVPLHPTPIVPPAPSADEAKASMEQPTPADTPSKPAVADAPVQTAKAAPPAPPQTSDAKADHRWLAELLWKRVAEFKRYPSQARLNGLEGKVVLKAVIRADGQLVEVTIQKSSGHPVLDAAAIETVKQATPLAMTQPLKRPEIVVSLPIVYSLSN